jgi:trypsin
MPRITLIAAATLAALALFVPAASAEPSAGVQSPNRVTAEGSADVANAADTVKPSTTDAGLQLSSLDQERMERQKPLIAAADIIQAAVDKDTQADPLSGYSSIALGERSVVLRWKGALPRTVDAAVEQARKDVTIEVLNARHTNARMQAKVAQVQQATKKLAGGVPFAVSMPIEGDKVRVEVEGDIITKVKTGLSALGLPVEVTYGDVPEPAGRLNDTPEFYGGGQLKFPWRDGKWKNCTAGFAVRHWSGQESLVTAGHCGYPGIGFNNGDWSRWVGQASQEHVYYDLLLVPTQDLGPSAGRVFNNRWGYSDTSMTVNGWTHPYHNEYMCTSGSFTGEVCGVQVDTSTAHSYCTTDAWGTPECYGGMYRAYQRAGLRAAQPGDSGGPVYNYNRSAMGIISGGNTSGTTVIFQDFHTVNQIWGVVPK